MLICKKLFCQFIYRIETTVPIENSIKSYEEKNARLANFLASSKDDIVVIGNDNEESTRLRDKRQFVISTTSTMITYSIITSTASTKLIISTLSTTASVSISSGAPTTVTSINCLPSGVRVC